MSLEVDYLVKRACEENHLTYMRYMFKNREGSKFIVNKHHEVICNTLDRVFSGEINRLIINIPPGYTKTEAAVIGFISRGLAINPKSKYIHVSYAATLATENSRVIQDVIQCDSYQKFWPMKFRKESTAVRKWYTDKGGGIIADSSGGKITGFRAGLMSRDVTDFTGAFIIDDPIKIDDAYSETLRNKVNGRVAGTFKSRLAHEGIPIIIIMQRVHEDDTTGFLLKGGTGEKWYNLVLPAEITEDYKYPKEYEYGIYIPHKLPLGALWTYKHTLEQLHVMKKYNPYTTASQYMQTPAPLEGGLYKESWWQEYDTDNIPEFEYKAITADTAQKTGEHNDYTVFLCFGVLKGLVYIIDIVRGKWESPDMRKVFITFWNKHYNKDAVSGKLRRAYIEDKVSGTDLIQNIRRETNIPIQPLSRSTDKVTRALDSVPYIASGRVYIPREAPWKDTFKNEIKSFTPTMSHKHDDQVDALNDAIAIGIGAAKKRAGSF